METRAGYRVAEEVAATFEGAAVMRSVGETQPKSPNTPNVVPAADHAASAFLVLPSLSSFSAFATSF